MPNIMRWDKLSYESWGDSDQIILMLHGFPENKDAWLRYGEYLVAHTHLRMVAVDLPGYGKSTIDNEGTLDPRAAPDRYVLEPLLHFAMSLSPAPIYLLGHDWGGSLAWLLMDQKPQAFAGATIMAGPHPNIFRNLLQYDEEQQKAAGHITLLQSPTALALCQKDNFAFLKQELFSEHTHLSQAQKDSYLNCWSNPKILKSMIWYYTAFFDKPYYLLAAPQAPIQVFWGGRDHRVTVKNAEHIHKLWPHIIVEEDLGAGHWLLHSHFKDIAPKVAHHAQMAFHRLGR